jgi:hypothetical protein
MRWWVAAALVFVQASTLKPPTPVEPIGAILDAFKTHDLVGLGPAEGHGDIAGPGAFVVSLINDPRFAPLPIDVVMENASSRYQAVMDRYVVAGEDVPYAELRHVWDETTQPAFMRAPGDVPATYVALRKVNRTLPEARRHRALLGDSPIEWEHVHTPADFRQWLQVRDSNPAAVIRRESLAKGRQVLVNYGDGHLQRKQQLTNYVMGHPLAETIVSLLERDGVSTFIVTRTTEHDDVASWPIPSLALIRGTTIGAEDVPPFAGYQRGSVQPDGSLLPIPKEQWKSMKREAQYDAVLKLPPYVPAGLSPSICSDAGYVTTHLERMATAGLPPSEIDRIRKICDQKN